MAQEECEKSEWVTKLSDNLKRWRRRYAVAKDYEIRFSEGINKPAHYILDLRLCSQVLRSNWRGFFKNIPDVVRVVSSSSKGICKFYGDTKLENDHWVALIERNFVLIRNGEEFLQAVASGSLTAVNSSLCSPNVYINYSNSEGSTALHVACKHGFKDVLSALLNCDVDINTLDKNHRSPLHEAAEEGKIDIVRQLIEYKANISTATLDAHRSPLYTAIEHGYKDVAKLLIEAGADVNSATSWGETPLYRATKLEDRELMELLIAASADLNLPTNNDYTPIYAAVEKGNAELLAVLLDTGKVDLHIANAVDLLTPLHCAVKARNYTLVDMLLAAGADPNITTQDTKATALLMATELQDIEMVKKLLAAHARIDMPNSSNKVPLDIAVELNHAEMMGLFQTAARSGGSNVRSKGGMIANLAPPTPTSAADATRRSRSRASRNSTNSFA